MVCFKRSFPCSCAIHVNICCPSLHSATRCAISTVDLGFSDDCGSVVWWRNLQALATIGCRPKLWQFAPHINVLFFRTNILSMQIGKKLKHFRFVVHDGNKVKGTPA